MAMSQDGQGGSSREAKDPPPKDPSLLAHRLRYRPEWGQMINEPAGGIMRDCQPQGYMVVGSKGKLRLGCSSVGGARGGKQP